MTRLAQYGAELAVSSGDAPAASAVFLDGQYNTGNVAATRVTTPVRTGVGAYSCAQGAPAGGVIEMAFGMPGSAVSRTIFTRAYVRLPSFAFMADFPGGGFGIATGSDTNIRACLSFSTTAPKLGLFNGLTQVGSYSLATLSVDTWYRVEFSVTYNASGQITAFELRLDGVTVASTSGLTQAATTNSVHAGVLNNTGATAAASVFIDDVAINDNAGSVNNSWCGPGGIVMAVPTADSTVGSGWTDSGGAGSSLFASVDNNPPLGIADTTASAGHQIRNAASALSDYDAVLTTYGALGINFYDIINAVILFASTAAPVTTGSKTGTIEMVSNPVIAAVALALTGGSATFWSGVAAGSYPTGWKWSAGGISEAPAFNVSTGAVMRAAVTGGTASRVAMVETMIAMVEFTPGTPPPPLPEGFYAEKVLLQAVKRGALFCVGRKQRRPLAVA